MSHRTEAANLANGILYNLGGLSALVPRGPLRDLVDEEMAHAGDLAEAIARLPRDKWADWVDG